MDRLVASPETFRDTEVGVLPKNWELASLGELFDVQQGKALSPSARSGVSPRPFLRTANVRWGRLDLETVDQMHFTEDEVTRLSLRSGDLLICEGGEIGRTAVWRGEIDGCTYQNHVHRLRSKRSDIVPEFVMYWMQAALLQLGLYGGVGNRTTIPDLSAARLKQLPIPLPPFPEQRAIAAILSKTQVAVEMQDRLVATVKELKAATMAKLFREGLRGEPLKQTEIGEIPESWKVVQLGRIAQIGNGSTPKRDNPSYWENGTIPWLTSAKVHESVIECADEFVSDTARTECHLLLVRKGSILVEITGQGKTLGNAALVRFDTCVSQHLAYIQFETKEVLPEFMLFFLQGRYEHLRQVSQSGGSTKGALTCGFLKGYWVPIPSLQEQSQIASTLGVLLTRLRTEEARCRGLGALFASVLNLFMTGRVRVRMGAQVGEAAARPRQGGRVGGATAAPGPLPEGVEQFVAELVRRFEPERVILFGQHAEASPKAFEEVGLLVEMGFEGLARDQAARIAHEIPHDFSLDLLVRRPRDLRRAVEMGDRFLGGIVERGRVLYTRPASGARPAREDRPLEEAPDVQRPTLSQETLQEIVRRIVDAVAPEKIILFGSAARGEMGPDSDLDFLVVKHCENRHETATAVYRGLRGISVPVDIVVVTPKDVERHKDTIGYVLRPALREGKVVYAA